MPAPSRIRRKTDRPIRSRSGAAHTTQDAFVEFSRYLEEEKLKTRREVSQQINQWLVPFISKLDKTTLLKSDLAALLQRKLEEMAALPSTLLRRTLSQLSPAEWQVCLRLRQGQRTKQIAEDLSLSPATVENQRNAIRRKLGLAHAENLVTFLQQL